MSFQVHLVVNGVVLAAYSQKHIADTHARTVTGGRVVSMMVRDELADEARSDIETEIDDTDDWDDQLTPVEPVEEEP